jgi:TrmH family RNA methyltransferase
VKHARKLARDSGVGDALVVEGARVVGEALPWVQRLFVTPDGAERHGVLVEAARARAVEVREVNGDVFASMADTATPQGVLGVARLPLAELADVLAAAKELRRRDGGGGLGAGPVVVLAGVSDPGNAGAAVRTTDAAGCTGVVLTGDSVAVGNPKAVRASAGSLFHLPVVAGPSLDAVVEAAAGHGLTLVAADARGATGVVDTPLAGPVAMLFGNEAHGLPAEIVAACDYTTALPMPSRARAGYSGPAESVNLAATVAVCVYEAARQRTSSRDGPAPTRRRGSGAQRSSVAATGVLGR